MNKGQFNTKSLEKYKSFNKFDSFFSGNKKEYIYQEESDNPFAISLSTKLTRSSSMANNLQKIQEKSSLKGKVQTYLLDSRKIGVLDKKNSSNKKTLTKISESQKKIPNNQIEQNKAYLTKLKNEYSQFCNKSSSTDREIRNLEGTIAQTKQKIIFYENILSMTTEEQIKLLQNREQKIVWARFQHQVCRNIKQRLKLVNQTLRKRVKNTLAVQRAALNQNRLLNQQVGHTKQATDKKQYAMNYYKNLEGGKTQQLAYKCNAAETNISLQNAAEILKKKQDSIVVLQKDQYRYDVVTNAHTKLLRELRVMQLNQAIINAARNRSLSFYKEYEKAETLMKMFSLDPQFQVCKSYERSFQLREDLKQKIEVKQNKIKDLERRHQQLCDNWLCVGFSGVELNQQNNVEDMNRFEKSISRRHHKSIMNITLCNRIKFWVKKQEQKLGIKPAKKSSLVQHLKEIIQTIKAEVRQFERNQLNKEQIKQKDWDKSNLKSSKIKHK